MAGGQAVLRSLAMTNAALAVVQLFPWASTVDARRCWLRSVVLRGQRDGSKSRVRPLDSLRPVMPPIDVERWIRRRVAAAMTMFCDPTDPALCSVLVAVGRMRSPESAKAMLVWLEACRQSYPGSAPAG